MTNLRIRPAVASLPRYVPSKTAPDAVKISSNEMPRRSPANSRRSTATPT